MPGVSIKYSSSALEAFFCVAWTNGQPVFRELCLTEAKSLRVVVPEESWLWAAVRCFSSSEYWRLWVPKIGPAPPLLFSSTFPMQTLLLAERYSAVLKDKLALPFIRWVKDKAVWKSLVTSSRNNHQRPWLALSLKDKWPARDIPVQVAVLSMLKRMCV